MFNTPLHIIAAALVSFFVPLLLMVCLGSGRSGKVNAPNAKTVASTGVTHLVFAPKKVK